MSDLIQFTDEDRAAVQLAEEYIEALLAGDDFTLSPSDTVTLVERLASLRRRDTASPLLRALLTEE